MESKATDVSTVHRASETLLRKPGDLTHPARASTWGHSHIFYALSDRQAGRQTDKAALTAWQPLRAEGEADLLVTQSRVWKSHILAGAEAATWASGLLSFPSQLGRQEAGTEAHI